jgi:hypothetical protein
MDRRSPALIVGLQASIQRGRVLRKGSAALFSFVQRKTVMTAKSNLFMFRSEKSAALHGFAMESAGVSLPQKFGPWAGVGVVRPDQVPPHGLRREAIESGIAANGYQLWRKKTP